MKKLFVSLLPTLLLFSQLYAQQVVPKKQVAPSKVTTTAAQDPIPPLTISGVLNVDQYKLVELTLSGPPIDSAIFDVLYAPNIMYVVSQTMGNEKGTKLIFTGPSGDYRVSAYASSNGKMMSSVVAVTIKGTAPPEPTPPDPNPTPPDPVTPPPIAAPGLRVLIVYESADITKMSKEQSGILYSTDLRNYLNQACVKVNNLPDYRMYDKDMNAANDTQIWQDALKRPRGSIPWLLISNGITGFEGPLPQNTVDTINLIKKYDTAAAAATKKRMRR